MGDFSAHPERPRGSPVTTRSGSNVTAEMGFRERRRKKQQTWSRTPVPRRFAFSKSVSRTCFEKARSKKVIEIQKSAKTLGLSSRSWSFSMTIAWENGLLGRSLIHSRLLSEARERFSLTGRDPLRRRVETTPCSEKDAITRAKPLPGSRVQ